MPRPETARGGAFRTAIGCAALSLLGACTCATRDLGPLKFQCSPSLPCAEGYFCDTQTSTCVPDGGAVTTDAGPGGDGGGNTCDAGCSTGDICQGGRCQCDTTACQGAGGCCGFRCHFPLQAQFCGAPGSQCVDCTNNLVGDSCSSSGSCLCGGGAACNPSQGQYCAGTCVCDATSCPTGCCQGNVCITSFTATACGAAGQPCQNCGAGTCNAGGACSSCATTCDGGCCSGSTCLAPSKFACAPAFQACVQCDTRHADTCVNGSCQCGTSAPCSGTECCSGACCPTATPCCDNGTCGGCGN